MNSIYLLKSVAFETLILQVELHQLLTHHIQLRFVVFLDDHLLCLSRFKLSLKVLRRVLFLGLHLVELFLPLSVFLHDLQGTALAESIDTLHLVGHLANLVQRFLL